MITQDSPNHISSEDLGGHILPTTLHIRGCICSPEQGTQRQPHETGTATSVAFVSNPMSQAKGHGRHPPSAVQHPKGAVVHTAEVPPGRCRKRTVTDS